MGLLYVSHTFRFSLYPRIRSSEEFKNDLATEINLENNKRNNCVILDYQALVTRYLGTIRFNAKIQIVVTAE